MHGIRVVTFSRKLRRHQNLANFSPMNQRARSIPRGLSRVSQVNSRRGRCGNEKTWIWLRNTTTSLQQTTSHVHHTHVQTI